MRNQIYLFFILIILFPFAIAAQTYNWNEVGQGGFSEGEVRSICMSLDGTTPYVAYIDLVHERKISVQKFNGSSWEYVGSPGFTEPADILDFEIENGVFYLAYVADEKLSVMNLMGGIWKYVGEPQFLTTKDVNLSIAAGVPYIVFPDYSDDNMGELTVMKYGSNWEIVGPKAFTPSSPGVFDIAAGQKIYVVFRHYEKDLKATVMTLNNNEWIVLGNEGFSGGTLDTRHCITIYNNSPCVVSWNSNAQATVYTFTGTKWEIMGNEGLSAGQAVYPTLTTGADGLLYVAYNDIGNENKIYMKRYNNGVWESIGNAVSKLSGDNLTIAVDNTGKPYAAYKDNWYMRRATVMEYSKNDGIVNIPTGLNVELFPNPTRNTITISNIAGSTIYNITLYNETGKEVLHFEKETKPETKITISLASLPQGVYLLNLKTNKGFITKKVIKN